MLYKLVLLFLLFLCNIQLSGQQSPTPTPYMLGINLATGKIENPNSNAYDYTYDKEKRVVSVKTKESSQLTEFSYFPRGTEVIENQRKKSKFYFTNNQLISAIEHYRPNQSNWTLYRKESLFWNQNAQLVSRTLEDHEGNCYHCLVNEYNKGGLLIKETLYGNLSGACSIPLVIQKNGTPLSNGIESYSMNYFYTKDGANLLERQADNQGFTTEYLYNKEKQCIGKLKGNGAQIISRCFYAYDAMGCLIKTIVDNGCGKSINDLTGVTSRQIMATTSSHAPHSFGQPLIIENKFWDLGKHEEVTADKTICTYSEEGELIQQDFFDGNGKLLSSTQPSASSPASPLQEEEYMSDLQCTLSIDENGNETRSFHDCFGRVVEIRLPEVLDENDLPYHPQITQQYNVCNSVVSVQDGDGNRTETTYNARGKPACITFPDGTTECYRYFLDGELKEKIGRNGGRTVMSRDSFGRITELCEYSCSNQLIKRLIYTYEGTRVQSIVEDKTYTAVIEYDGAGQKTGFSVDTKDGVRRIDYTQTAQESDNTHEEPIHTESKVVKNSRNQFVKSEELVDKEGIRQVGTYDALGRLENVTLYNSLGIKLSEKEMRYNAGNQKTQEKHFVFVQDAIEGTYTIKWEYDCHNKVTAIHEGVGTSSQKSTHHHYDLFGQLIQTTKPNGIALHYRYNENGLIVESWASDHSFHYEFVYDNRQRLTAAYDHIHGLDLHRRYDDLNQVIAESCGRSYMGYHYDSDGQCTLVNLPDNTQIRYRYADSRLTSVERLEQDGTIRYAGGFEYDPASSLLVKSELPGSSGAIHYSYDQDKRLARIESPWWSERVLSRDGCGRVLSTINEDLNGSTAHHYTYAADGQLTADNERSYLSDTLYNRLSENGKPWTVNEINQLIRTPHFQLKYDQNGNLIEKTGSSIHQVFAYDALDRLIRVETDELYATDYIYDALNRRIAEKSYLYNSLAKRWELESTSQYLYQHAIEIGKLNAQGQIVELKVMGAGSHHGADLGSACNLEIDGRLFAPIHDRMGSVRCLIDLQDHSMAEFYRYTSDGLEHIFDSDGSELDVSPTKNPWRYNCKRTDEMTGFVFFGLRYYDPQMARWITPNPLSFADGPNLYAFVKNDPINHFDHYGLFSLSSIWEFAQDTISNCFNNLRMAPQRFRNELAAELHLSDSFCESINSVSESIFGEFTCRMLGNAIVKSESGAYGEGEINPKVRITYINGILNNNKMLHENLNLISSSHGGVKVHYIFRGTKGWSWDVTGAILIKSCYLFGYRSPRAYALADKWRSLIEEMGGVDGGGVIIHYAHSLGGSDTDRARSLLTPAEQKMIRVFTLGSATMVRDEGFQQVINIISANDGVCYFDPLGHIRNYFDPKSNVRKYGYFTFWGLTVWPTDHLLNGCTYRPILTQLGEYFLDEFG